jgi:hypothetical protein
MGRFDRYETKELEFPKYPKEILKHQRNFQIPNSKALKWSSFDKLNNQIITTGKDGIVYSLNLENLKLKIIWNHSSDKKLEFSQILIHKNFILLFGTELVILKDEKKILQIDYDVYFRSNCLFSDGTIAIGFEQQTYKIGKISDLFVGKKMKFTGKVCSSLSWVYSVVNIEEKYIGICLKKYSYSLINKKTGKSVFEWKDSNIGTVLCSFYDSQTKYLFLGTFETKLIVIHFQSKEIELVILFEGPISWILEIPSGKLAISTYLGDIVILDKYTFECEQILKFMNFELTENKDIYHLELIGDEIVASNEDGILSFWKVMGFNLKKLFQMLKNNKDTNVFFTFV